jgi:hypothetical protein
MDTVRGHFDKITLTGAELRLQDPTTKPALLYRLNTWTLRKKKYAKIKFLRPLESFIKKLCKRESCPST